MQNKYIGVKCPVCQTEFKEGDDIAVCPECATPYHRECIKSVGECVNKDKHAEGFVFELPNKPHERIYVSNPNDFIECPRCGENNPPENSNCRVCQTPLDKEPSYTQGTTSQHSQPVMFGPFMAIDLEEELDGVKVKEISAHIKHNQRYYLPRFKFLSGERWFNWNWGAFFFTSYYYLYRKMWLWGILLFVFEFLIETASLVSIYMAMQGNLSEQPYMLISTVIQALTMFVRFASSVLANKLYRTHVISKIKKIKAKYTDKQDYERKLSQKGGVSFLSILATFGVMVVLSAILYVAALYIPQVEHFVTEITKLMIDSMAQGGQI